MKSSGRTSGIFHSGSVGDQPTPLSPGKQKQQGRENKPKKAGQNIIKHEEQ
jgi:hypothetical protein